MTCKLILTAALVARASAVSHRHPSTSRTVAACTGMNGIDESCQLSLNAQACAVTRCSKLVVIFSGGEMGCTKGHYDGALDDYSANGWAAACINIFETSTGSGKVPYFQERDRLNTAVEAVTASDWGRAYWTGEHLLLQGVSHGTIAPMVNMARGGVDKLPAWQGTAFTAACFFDGSPSPAASASLLATGGLRGSACTVPVSHARWVGRYCPDSPQSCNLTANADALTDTIEDVAPQAFHVRTWRITECGSELRPCTGDIFPMAPQQKLCTSIDGAVGYSCEFTRLPTDSHSTCHKTHSHSCRVWYDGLLRQRTTSQSSTAASTASKITPAQTATLHEMTKAAFARKCSTDATSDECKQLAADIKGGPSGSGGSIDLAKMDKATLMKLIAATQKYYNAKCKPDKTTAECKGLEAKLAQGNAAKVKLDATTPASTVAPVVTGAASTAAPGAGVAGAVSTAPPAVTSAASTAAPGDASAVAKAVADAATKAYTAAGCDTDGAKDGCAELKMAKAAADAKVADLAEDSGASGLAASIAAVLVGAIAAVSF